jgi:hypothetical protein
MHTRNAHAHTLGATHYKASGPLRSTRRKTGPTDSLPRPMSLSILLSVSVSTAANTPSSKSLLVPE